MLLVLGIIGYALVAIIKFFKSPKKLKNEKNFSPYVGKFDYLDSQIVTRRNKNSNLKTRNVDTISTFKKFN